MKKIILLILVLFSLLTVVACNDEQPTEAPTDLPTDVTSIKLAAPVVVLSEEGVASWSSVENAIGYSYIINDNAAVNTASTSITLNDGESFKVMAVGDGVNYTNSDYSNVVTFTVDGSDTPTDEPTEAPTEAPTDSDYDTITSLSTDKEYQIRGTVVGKTAKSFVVSDSTGLVLVYVGTEPTVEVGNVVTVGGTPEIYGGAIQFGSTSTYEVVSTATISHPTPTTLTSTVITQLVENKDNVILDYVTITGTLSISSGKYYNVEVAGLDNIYGSISYPINGTELAELAGQTIVVTGYFVGITGSSKSYINICATSVTLASVDVPTPDVPTEDEVVDLNKITLNSMTVSLDGEEHSIYVSNLPTGYTVEYTGNGVSELGTYTVTAKVYDAEGTLVKELSATITIVEKYDVELPLV